MKFPITRATRLVSACGDCFTSGAEHVLEAWESGFSNLCTAPRLVETKTTRATVANIILQPIILRPHTVLFRSVGSTITPSHIRSLFCGSKIETIETYSFL